jgi:hypothetical protein
MKPLKFLFRVFWLQGTEMFVMCATGEMQRLLCFDSGDAYNDGLKPLQKPWFPEKKLTERNSKFCGYFVRLYAT